MGSRSTVQPTFHCHAYDNLSVLMPLKQSTAHMLLGEQFSCISPVATVRCSSLLGLVPEIKSEESVICKPFTVCQKLSLEVLLLVLLERLDLDYLRFGGLIRPEIQDKVDRVARGIVDDGGLNLSDVIVGWWV